MSTYSPQLFSFLKSWEGFKATVSVDSLSPGTRDIGHGHKILPGETFGTITREQAGVLLLHDIVQFEKWVNQLVKVPLKQHQFDALLSFTYNLGPDIDEDTKAEGLGDSTLLKFVNASQFDKAALEFPLWNKAGGLFRWGLAQRRLAEQVMFYRGDYTWRP